jgi:hypothetical protein
MGIEIELREVEQLIAEAEHRIERQRERLLRSAPGTHRLLALRLLAAMLDTDAKLRARRLTLLG